MSHSPVPTSDPLPSTDASVHSSSPSSAVLHVTDIYAHTTTAASTATEEEKKKKQIDETLLEDQRVRLQKRFHEITPKKEFQAKFSLSEVLTETEVDQLFACIEKFPNAGYGIQKKEKLSHIDVKGIERATKDSKDIESGSSITATAVTTTTSTPAATETPAEPKSMYFLIASSFCSYDPCPIAPWMQADEAYKLLFAFGDSDMEQRGMILRMVSMGEGNYPHFNHSIVPMASISHVFAYDSWINKSGMSKFYVYCIAVATMSFQVLFYLLLLTYVDVQKLRDLNKHDELTVVVTAIIISFLLGKAASEVAASIPPVARSGLYGDHVQKTWEIIFVSVLIVPFAIYEITKTLLIYSLKGKFRALLTLDLVEMSKLFKDPEWDYMGGCYMLLYEPMLLFLLSLATARVVAGDLQPVSMLFNYAGLTVVSMIDDALPVMLALYSYKFELVGDDKTPDDIQVKLQNDVFKLGKITRSFAMISAIIFIITFFASAT